MTLNTAEISPDQNPGQTSDHPAMSWYILKQPEGHCQVISAKATTDFSQEHWGPYSSQSEAIAKRVGLIRSGKCQPV